MGKTSIKTRPFDPAEHLRDGADIAAYLQVVLDDEDPALLAAALGDIARARGMSQLAHDTGLSHESLYKSLSDEQALSSETLFKVLRALGLKLTVQPG